MIAYDKLKAHRFEPVVQSYTARDCWLYALGLNIGADPMDPAALRHAASDSPEPVVTMPMMLGRPGPWMQDPEVGIDYRRIVVGEVALRLHARLPPAATLRADHSILRITDKGAGRGALVTLLRRLTDTGSGRLLAEYEQVTFCRGDGGFAVDGRHDPAPPPSSWTVPDRPADTVLDLATLPQQALIFRLSGDYNPLHSEPEVARKAGFERPILHGLATMGMVGHALDRLSRDSGGPGLASLRARLTGPVIPGEVLRLAVWHEPGTARFRTVDGSGREVVGLGQAEFQNVD